MFLPIPRGGKELAKYVEYVWLSRALDWVHCSELKQKREQAPRSPNASRRPEAEELRECVIFTRFAWSSRKNGGFQGFSKPEICGTLNALEFSKA